MSSVNIILSFKVGAQNFFFLRPNRKIEQQFSHSFKSYIVSEDARKILYKDISITKLTRTMLKLDLGNTKVTYNRVFLHETNSSVSRKGTIFD